MTDAAIPREADQQGLETRSEAVYLDCVSDDGMTGCVARLCRYPLAGFAWVWVHLFHKGRVLACSHHELPCDASVTDPSAHPTRYSLAWAGGEMDFLRRGGRAAPVSAELRCRALVHNSPHPPHGDGTLPVRVQASFRAAAVAVSNRAGRTEALGGVSVTAEADGETLSFTGRGQFHEQVQTEPRFTRPFSYLTLRGPDLGLIAIRGRDGARGYLIRPDSVTEVIRVQLTPPGSRRWVVLHGRKGERVHGELRTTHDYSIPVFDGYRPGSLVSGTLLDTPVSGCVNDFLADSLTFDRWRPDGALR